MGITLMGLRQDIPHEIIRFEFTAISKIVYLTGYTRNMTVARGLFYLASVFLAVVILFGCYLFYRYAQTPSGETVIRMFQQGKLANLPSTSCVYKTSDFDGTDEGVLLLNNGNMLLKTVTVKGNAAGQLQVVILSDGTYRIDPRTSAAMLQGGDRKESVDPYITSKSWECSPWWFPDEALFNVSE